MNYALCGRHNASYGHSDCGIDTVNTGLLGAGC